MRTFGRLKCFYLLAWVMITAGSCGDITFVQCRLLLLLELFLFAVDVLLGLFLVVTAMFFFLLFRLEQRRGLSRDAEGRSNTYLIFVRFFAIATSKNFDDAVCCLLH